jgi:hypothetical protein
MALSSASLDLLKPENGGRATIAKLCCVLATLCVDFLRFLLQRFAALRHCPDAVKRNPPFTKAAVRRLINAVESADWSFIQVTVSPDGAITVHGSRNKPGIANSSGLQSWDDD